MFIPLVYYYLTIYLFCEPLKRLTFGYAFVDLIVTPTLVELYFVNIWFVLKYIILVTIIFRSFTFTFASHYVRHLHGLLD